MPQLVHVSWNSHVSATPFNRDAKDLYDSPLSCVVWVNTNVATMKLSSTTAMALMAARSLASRLSSMGVGPLVVLVRSRHRFGSRNSSIWMPRSVPASL